MPSRIILNGLRSIEECLQANPERVSKILIAQGKVSSRVEQIRQLAQQKRIPIEPIPKNQTSFAGILNAEDPVLAVLKEYEYTDFTSFKQECSEQIQEKKKVIILALDGITDPHNLGAILRTAAFMGVFGVILPRERSVSITETVYRIASGGLEYLQVTQVTNLVSALKELKEVGFWTVGFSEHSNQELKDLRKDFSPVIVIGNEEKGIRPLVKENCDFFVSLKPRGKLKSLNASVAASLAMSWATDIL